METLELKNGEIVNLSVDYFHLFKFMRERKEIAKDLLLVVQENNNKVDLETVIQILYVGYLGGSNSTNYSYEEFMNMLEFDVNKASSLFQKLVRPQKNVNSKNPSEELQKNQEIQNSEALN